MKAIKITLDEHLAFWLEAHAARHNITPSELIAQLLETRRAAYSKEILVAFRTFQPRAISQQGERAFNREEISKRSKIE